MYDERYNKQVNGISDDSVGDKVSRYITYSKMSILGIDGLSSKSGDTFWVVETCSCVAAMHVGSL